MSAVIVVVIVLMMVIVIPLLSIFPKAKFYLTPAIRASFWI